MHRLGGRACLGLLGSGTRHARTLAFLSIARLRLRSGWQLALPKWPATIYEWGQGQRGRGRVLAARRQHERGTLDQALGAAERYGEHKGCGLASYGALHKCRSREWRQRVAVWCDADRGGCQQCALVQPAALLAAVV